MNQGIGIIQGDNEVHGEEQVCGSDGDDGCCGDEELSHEGLEIGGGQQKHCPHGWQPGREMNGLNTWGPYCSEDSQGGEDRGRVCMEAAIHVT